MHQDHGESTEERHKNQGEGLAAASLIRHQAWLPSVARGGSSAKSVEGYGGEVRVGDKGTKVWSRFLWDPEEAERRKSGLSAPIPMKKGCRVYRGGGGGYGFRKAGRKRTSVVWKIGLRMKAGGSINE